MIPVLEAPQGGDGLVVLDFLKYEGSVHTCGCVLAVALPMSSATCFIIFAYALVTSSFRFSRDRDLARRSRISCGGHRKCFH